MEQLQEFINIFLDYSMELGEQGKFFFAVMILLILSGLLTSIVQIYKITTKFIVGISESIFGNLRKVFTKKPIINKGEYDTKVLISLENSIKELSQKIENKKKIGDIL